ncbi:thymus-specific serine protease [Clinocottus analis]|uniref:thymus-specific serine protease n=1 Tax=Clinocottus analis TaxID=304258 RepID=UPI0035C175DB
MCVCCSHVDMALQRCVSLLCPAALLLLLSGCVGGHGRFKGFGNFRTLNGGEHAAGKRSASEELWFTQKLDHFNGADGREWKQRYFVNEAFYRPGGPVFLMIGGEGPSNPAWMQSGTWLTYAEQLGALCFLLEHRFYGKSRPTADLTLGSLRFLSSQQALADLAHFRSALAAARGLAASRWVAFGGSYPGSLATWFRVKYPHLVHAAVATSAPLYATVNFPEYLEVVWRSLASERADCPVVLQEASRALVERLSDPKTYDNITKDFNLCSKLQIENKMDSAYFLEMLAGNFMDVVQYNEDNRGFEGAVGTNITIKLLCGVMADASLGDPYARYAAVARLMMDAFSIKCLNTGYESYRRDMTDASWDGPAAGGGRQWVYQTCTEFGFFQSTDSPNQPFSGFPLPYHVQQCADFYNISGARLAAAVAQTNEQYGGYGVRSSRIVLPNGSIDPWHALGATQDITPELPAVFIKGTAHCANMYPARSEDLPQLALARDHIFLLLQKWLKP